MSDLLTGLNIASQAANTIGSITSANAMNKATRKFSKEMYEQQYRDNVEFWKMQNAYNDPSMQMARLKAAGLNPNLIFGNGSLANQADKISPANVENWNPQVPQWNLNLTEGLRQQAALEYNKIQSDNLLAQRKYIEQQTLRAAADTARIGMDTAMKDYSLQYRQKAEETLLEINKATLENLNLTNQKTENQIAEAKQRLSMDINDYDRKVKMWSLEFQRAGLTNQKIQKDILNTLENTAKTREEKNMLFYVREQNILNNILKKIEVYYRQQGINPNSNQMDRMAQGIVEGLKQNVMKGGKTFKYRKMKEIEDQIMFDILRANNENMGLPMPNY